MPLERSRQLIGGIWKYVSAQQSDNGNGGSQPENVRRLDLGVVDATDLLTGSATLYEAGAGEFVMPTYLTDVTFCDANIAIGVYGDEVDFAINSSFLAVYDNDLGHDQIDNQIQEGDNGRLAPGTGTIKASLFAGIGGSQPAEAWQANHAYDGSALQACVIGAGHLWVTSDDGDSGGSTPDWAGNFAGTVTDGDLTWTDVGPVTMGSAHFYADVATPAAP